MPACCDGVCGGWNDERRCSPSPSGAGGTDDEKEEEGEGEGEGETWFGKRFNFHPCILHSAACAVRITAWGT